MGHRLSLPDNPATHRVSSRAVAPNRTNNDAPAIHCFRCSIASRANHAQRPSRRTEMTTRRPGFLLTSFTVVINYACNRITEGSNDAACVDLGCRMAGHESRLGAAAAHGAG